MNKKKILILGAGPGGYAAAFLAADKGMDVTLVDAEVRPGGVCLHRGCIPSKTILHLAKLIHEAREAKLWGLDFNAPRIDLGVMRKWKTEVIDKMASGLVNLCKQRGVQLVQGKAAFTGSHSVRVEGRGDISFDHCILAVGSRPIVPVGFPDNENLIMDSTVALDLQDIPERLLIVGGGYIGLEMGTLYAALGSRVTVVEMTDGLLPGVDPDLVRILTPRLKRNFENIFLGTRVDSVTSRGNSVSVTLSGKEEGREEIFNRVLVSVGRRPNSDEIGLEHARVETDHKGFVKVDAHFQTGNPAIMAIGDVIGGAMLAHKASHEGKSAVEHICGDNGDMDSQIIPAVVFTDPEIAWCGLTESEAKAKGMDVTVSKFPWGASGRAQTLGRPDGVTKLIMEPRTGRILGMGIVGSGAGELIAEGVLAVKLGATAKDLAATIHPHPTLSETLMESAEVFLGTATHVFKKQK